MCYCTRVILVHYRTDDTCATVPVRHARTDRNTRALPTRGHARPGVHRADRRIANFCAHRSLCYSTRARWPHVGTPGHVCTVYGRSGLNLRARAGRYTSKTTAAIVQYFGLQAWNGAHVICEDFLIGLNGSVADACLLCTSKYLLAPCEVCEVLQGSRRCASVY